MKRIFVKTWSSSEHDNASCDFAIIEVTPELVALIKHRQGITAAIEANSQDFAHLAWWDHTASFIEAAASSELLESVYGEKIRDEILEGEYWIEPATVTPHPFEPLSTEMDKMYMDNDKLWWKATPRHTDLYLETHALSIGTLLRVGEDL